ncbi:MAG: FHA domain-containing protein [Candidatus Aminicenantales bacterium]
MKRLAVVLGLALLAVPLLLSPAGAADQVWINDIRANPVRFWNTTVTVIGMVQEVKSEPLGTTRGFYTIMDDSIVTGVITAGELPYNQLIVRTNNLPPIGKTFSVTGTVIQDPTRANLPILKEISRSSPGMSVAMKIILVAAILLFIALIVTFVLLLTRPKRAAAEQAGRPGATARIPSQAPAPAAGKTQVYLNLGADLIIEKGPDKGKEFALTKLATTIGRAGARKNDVELSDDTVSKEQATINYDNAKKIFTIVNESSTNPTRANGTPVSGSAVVENNTVVEIGRTQIRFRKP